jgi:hypothetical protein
MTERKICDGKENVCDVKTFWFIITTNNINQMHEAEYNTLNGAQSHSRC